VYQNTKNKKKKNKKRIRQEDNCQTNLRNKADIIPSEKTRFSPIIGLNAGCWCFFYLRCVVARIEKIYKDFKRQFRRFE